MIKTNSLIDNHFIDLHGFSRETNQMYTYLHLNFMKSVVAQHPYLGPLIVATEAKYIDLFGTVAIKDQHIALRMAQRKSVVEVMAEAIIAAQSIESRARDKVKKDSLIYNEIFPHGITEYHGLRLHNAYILISRLKAATLKYETELGVDLKTLMINVYNDFDDARSSQTDTVGKIKDNNPDYTAKLDLMIIQLYHNLHTICLQNETNPSAGYGFFEQAVFNRKFHRAGDPNLGPWIESIMMESQKEAGIAFGIKNKITLKNMGIVPISYMGAFTEDEPMHPNSMVLLPGQEITITAEQLGSPNNKYLIFANKDTVDIAVIKITLS